MSLVIVKTSSLASAGTVLVLQHMCINQGVKLGRDSKAGLAEKLARHGLKTYLHRLDGASPNAPPLPRSISHDLLAYCIIPADSLVHQGTLAVLQSLCVAEGVSLGRYSKGGMAERLATNGAKKHRAQLLALVAAQRAEREEMAAERKIAAKRKRQQDKEDKSEEQRAEQDGNKKSRVDDAASPPALHS